MGIRINSKDLEKPQFKSLKERIDVHNANAMKQQSLLKNDKGTPMKLHVPTRKMKHQRQRNRFGFDLTHSALSRASDVLNIELSEQCDPLDEYFRGYDIHATSVASANNFPVGYWIRQGKVKEVITKL